MISEYKHFNIWWTAQIYAVVQQYKIINIQVFSLSVLQFKEICLLKDLKIQQNFESN